MKILFGVLLIVSFFCQLVKVDGFGARVNFPDFRGVGDLLELLF